jgi:CheY-like chemotaxis protein
LLNRPYAVRRTANGVEALAALGEDRPDLIPSNIMMPELGGCCELSDQISRLRTYLLKDN